jgi:hypothetical protein
MIFQSNLERLTNSSYKYKYRAIWLKNTWSCKENSNILQICHYFELEVLVINSSLKSLKEMQLISLLPCKHAGFSCANERWLFVNRQTGGCCFTSILAQTELSPCRKKLKQKDKCVLKEKCKSYLSYIFSDKHIYIFNCSFIHKNIIA